MNSLAKRSLLLAALFAFVAPSIAAADVNITPAGSTVIFDFTCFITKHCPAVVPTDAAGAALTGTAGSPSASALTVQGISGGQAMPVSGTFFQATQPVSGTVTANLGTLNGAATATNQTNVIGTKAAGAAAANSLLGGCVYNASGVSLSDTNQVATQCDIAGNIKVTGIGIAQGSPTSGQTMSLVAAAASTSPPTTTATNSYPLSMDAFGGVRTSTLNNGVGATASSVPANAAFGGCRAQNAEVSAGSNGNLSGTACDLVGKQIILPYANPENSVSGVTAAMTGTTPTSLMPSPGGSLRNYATLIYCVNSHATVSTFVNVTDGSGGTVLWSIYAGAAGGGAAPQYITPLRQPTTATALFVVDVTTGANVVCNASGYKGA